MHAHRLAFEMGVFSLLHNKRWDYLTEEDKKAADMRDSYM